MPVPSATVTQYYTGIFRQAPSAAVSAAYQAMATPADALNSMLSAANVSVDPVVRLYQTAFNRVPDSAGMTAWVVPFSTNQITLASIANGFTQSTEFTTLYPTSMSNDQFVGALYWNILQRAGEAAGMNGWIAALNNGSLTRAQVLLGFSESAEFFAKIEPNVNAFLTSAANNTATYTGSLWSQNAGTPVSYTLTTNIDTFGDANLSSVQQFNAANATFTALDKLTGGQSNADVLNVASTAAYANPAGATVTGIENVNLSLAAGGVVSTAAGSGFTGVTNLSVVSTAGALTSTVAAGTTQSVTNTITGAQVTTINGGSNITASVLGGGNIAAAGDRDLIIGSSAANAPTGTVTATYNASGLTSAGGAVVGGATTIIGGTTVVVNNLGANASNAANTATLGAVSVTGTAGTTSVTVNQSASQTQAVAAAAVAGVSNAVVARNSIVAGNVTINDVNAGSATAAGTITSVALNNLGGGATAAISSNALNSLTLSNSTATGSTAGGNITISYGLTTGSPTALTLNMNGGAFGTLATNGGAANAIATISAVMSANSTLAGITDAALRTLNLSGTGVLTLTAMNTAVTALTTADASGINANLSANTNLRSISMGGSGNNTVTLNSQLQAYTGGSGNDVVTITADALQTITGGTGTDTIVLGAAAATFTAANTAARVSGFETLGLNANSSGTYNLSTLGLTGVTAITLSGDVGAATVASNIAAGTALNINNALTNGFTYQLSGTAGPTSAVTANLNITGGNTTIAALTFQDSLANGIGTVNIVATNSIGNSVDTITTLTDSQINTLNLSGNAAVSITNAITTGATSFTLSNTSTSTGASVLGGITGNSIGAINHSGTHDTTITTLSDTAAIISITNANTSTTAGTGVLTIGGHVGNSLTSLTLNGAVAYTMTSNSTAAVAVSGATDNAAVSLTFTLANAGVKNVVLGNGANTIVTGTAADVITVGTGGNTITPGAAGDTVTLGAGTASSQIIYTAASQTFNAAVVSGTTALTAAAGADIIYGVQAGDTISLAGISNTFTGAVTTTLNSATGTTLDIVRGTWNATTGVFTTSATGTDSLVQWDADAAGAGTVIETVVLVGFVNTASTAAAGVLTLA